MGRRSRIIYWERDWVMILAGQEMTLSQKVPQKVPYIDFYNKKGLAGKPAKP
jgi:hypothetical protein